MMRTLMRNLLGSILKGKQKFTYRTYLEVYPNISNINELSRIRLGGLSIDLKGWNQLWYYGENNYEPSK